MMPNQAQQASNGAELEAIIARTALKYDLLPYTSNPFPMTQPSRTAALARLFGLETAPLANARVLELGCAAGGNIIPHAARYPAARFLGVDLSRTQVAAGRARIANLGLRNIEIQCQSFTELGPTDGEFDFIICHGVYSWVPGPVRDAILRICRERLSPVGLAMISYNVLPGWRLSQTLRDSFLIHIPDNHDSRSRVRMAREFLDFLSAHAQHGSAYKQILSSWSERFKNLPEDYVAHEFLEEINEPCTFRDFITLSQSHGLVFLGEADLPSMILDNQSAELAAKVRTLGQNQILATEQYMDLVTARTFRQTILVKSDRMGSISRNLSPERIEGLHLIGGADLRIERVAGSGGKLCDAAGRSLTAGKDEIIDALAWMVERFPASSTIDDLLDALPLASRSETVRLEIRDALYKMALVGLATLSSEPVSAAAKPSPQPMASALARGDAARGESATTNLRHERVAFDALGQVVCPLLDGTRDVPSLAGLVKDAVKGGRLTFHRDGSPIIGEQEIAAVSFQQVDAVLQSFARAGLLEA